MKVYYMQCLSLWLDYLFKRICNQYYYLYYVFSLLICMLHKWEAFHLHTNKDKILEDQFWKKLFFFINEKNLFYNILQIKKVHNRSHDNKSNLDLLINVFPSRNKMAFWCKICCFWVHEFSERSFIFQVPFHDIWKESGFLA